MEILQMHGEELFDTIDINLLCRICCKTSVIPLIPIYSGGSDSLASKIILYLPITISEDDIFPTKICIQCANSVIVWHEFFQNSIKADLKIKDILTKRGFQIDIETNNRVGSKLSDGDNSAVPPNLSSEGDEGTEFESEMQVKEELAEIKPSIQEIENIPSEPFSDQLSQDDNDLITDIVKIEPDDMQETQTSQDKSQEFGETSKSHKEEVVPGEQHKDLVSADSKEESTVTTVIDKNGQTRKRPLLYHRTSLEQKKILIKEIFEEGKTIAEAAVIAGVNKNTARNLVKIYRSDGEEIIQRKWGGRAPTKLTTSILNRIEQMIEDNQPMTLRTMKKLLTNDGINISTSTIHNGLKDLKITLKFDRSSADRITPSLEERKESAELFLQNVPSIEKCIFIDECGFNLHQGKSARVTPGRIVRDNMAVSPLVKGRFVTLIAAMSNHGIIYHKVLSNGVCSTVKFCDFLRELLLLLACQKDKHDAWIIVDNAQIHKTSEVKKVMSETTIQLRFFPWYSPVLNPLEGVFTKVKILARVILSNPTLNRSLVEVVNEGIDAVTSEDCGSLISDMMNELITTVKNGSCIN